VAFSERGEEENEQQGNDQGPHRKKDMKPSTPYRGEQKDRKKGKVKSKDDVQGAQWESSLENSEKQEEM